MFREKTRFLATGDEPSDVSGHGRIGLKRGGVRNGSDEVEDSGLMATRTFDASLRSAFFWLAVIVPPTGYWALVQVFAWQSEGAMASPVALMMLILLANLLPLAALGWMLCSVAAYTVAPGKVIEHRVVHDREFRLGTNPQVAALRDGVIAVRCENRTLRMRVTEPAVCLATLREAATDSAG